MRKLIIIILAIIILLSGAYFGFMNMGKEDAKEYKTEISKKVEAVKDLILDQIKSDEKAAGLQPSNQNAGKTNTPIAANTTQQKNNKENKKARIEAVYGKAFRNLEGQAHSLLNNLVAEAEHQYYSLPAADRKNPKVVAKLASEYINKGNVLEGQIDSVFQDILGQMKQELISENLDPSIADKYEKAYKQQKEAKRKEMLNLARKAY